MSQIAIEANGLSKLYHIGRLKSHNLNFQERVFKSLSAPFRRVGGLLKGRAAAISDLDEAFWALEDVSFRIDQGERVAVIGGNGAGKSTLLKILARVTHPTRGSATIRGRIGSLLEVGTGFHSELTGRENVFLNGSILGMRRAEVARKFDEIVAFAEVGQFIDTPVKHYSSGMQVRLAFSVAAHLEPEVLIVDEVLSVGDAAFRKKSLERTKDVAMRGTTVLVVSHNAQTITSICDRAIWLQKGRVVRDGPVHETVKEYLGGGLGLVGERAWQPDMAPGRAVARVTGIRLLSKSDKVATCIDVREACCVETDLEILQPGHGIVVNHTLFSSDGTECFSAIDTANPVWSDRAWAQGRYRLRMWIPGDLLQIDTYSIKSIVWSWEPVQAHQCSIPNALCFQVMEAPDGAGARAKYSSLGGVVRPLLNWEMEFESQTGAIGRNVSVARTS